MTEPDWLDEYDRILRSPFPMRGRMRMLSHEWNDSDIERLVSEVKRLRAESERRRQRAEMWKGKERLATSKYVEIWDEGLRAGMDSVLTAHERLADSRADWLPLVPTNPYRKVSDGSE